MSIVGTASGITRAMICPASRSLPQAPRQNAHQESGNWMHAFLAAVPEIGRDAALEQVPDEYRERCALIDLESLPPLDPKATAAEVAFVYNLDSDRGREIGRNIGRAYPELSEMEIAGTADVVALSADGEGVVIWDYKSPHHWCPAAKDNWQLRSLALMAARTYGRTRATVATIKIRDDGTVWYDQADFDEMDLDSFAVELCGLQDQIADLRKAVDDGKTPNVSMGPHCRYCPAFQSCPGQGQLVRALASDPSGDGYVEPRQLTPETAVRAYVRLGQVKQALKHVADALEAYARETPIPLPDGSVYGPVESSKEELDGQKTHDLLSRVHGPEVAARGAEFSASKASIERAMRIVYEREKKSGKKATLKDLVGGTLETLRKAGGIVKRTTTIVKEHRE